MFLNAPNKFVNSLSHATAIPGFLCMVDNTNIQKQMGNHKEQHFFCVSKCECFQIHPAHKCLDVVLSMDLYTFRRNH